LHYDNGFQKQCETLGGELAEIYDKSTNEFLSELAKNETGKRHLYIIM